MIQGSFFKNLAAACQPGGGFTLNVPTWYKYLDCVDDTPEIGSFSDIWKIAAAILEIIVYLGGVAAVFFVIFGGIQFIISQGQPDKIAQAKTTIINAVVGLVIAIIAMATVRFIAGGFGVEDALIEQNL